MLNVKSPRRYASAPFGIKGGEATKIFYLRKLFFLIKIAEEMFMQSSPPLMPKGAHA